MPRFSTIVLAVVGGIAVLGLYGLSLIWDHTNEQQAARGRAFERTPVHLVDGSTSIWSEYRKKLPAEFDRWRHPVRSESFHGEIREKESGTDRYGAVYTYLLVDRYPGVTLRVAGLVDAGEGESVQLSVPVVLSYRSVNHAPDRAEFFESFGIASAIPSGSGAAR